MIDHKNRIADLRVGNWIGGDRDGNPFVQAPQLRSALARGCEAAVAHYLDAPHALSRVARFWPRMWPIGQQERIGGPNVLDP